MPWCQGAEGYGQEIWGWVEYNWLWSNLSRAKKEMREWIRAICKCIVFGIKNNGLTAIRTLKLLFGNRIEQVERTTCRTMGLVSKQNWNKRQGVRKVWKMRHGEKTNKVRGWLQSFDSLLFLHSKTSDTSQPLDYPRYWNFIEERDEIFSLIAK